ncbi:cation:proton antiporter [Halobacteria archaeon AArc-m2/3/4]|uniref:Cation:proton antiporter n=1 Tax=Natronoglomus mannanivorans TaxID=2979990 RepID=A0AAP2YWS0_9EURY|nr:cation:proton antiporter [Halobacteria archaeon AArc-xg1-1]MCU4971449.1 cation:proton antiporter [Halobacteria archaeon AArc-m2/3/4]
MISDGLGIPITDSVAIFWLAIVVFLVAPLVLDRYRLPGIVGIIIAGATIGPNGLGILERGETIVLLGEVGLLYLMFVAGLEIDFARFVETRERSLVFGLLSFLIPQAVGTAAGMVLLGMSFPAASLFASIFASHTLLAFPVVSRLGLTDNESITATIGGTIVTDTIALLVLAVVVAAEVGTLDATFWFQLVLGVSTFFLGVWLVVPPLSRWFFRTVTQESSLEYLFVLAVAFGSAFLAMVAGIEAIVGAFLAGLALNRQIPHHGPLMNRIEFVGNALFIPFFLLSVGMLVDVRVLLEGWETLLVSTILVVAVLATKWAAAWATGAAFGYSESERMTMFGLSLGQAAAALAIVLVGYDVGLFGESVLNGTIVMILVVSVLSPAIVERYGREVIRTTGREEVTEDRLQRILVPSSATAEHRRGLFDLAFAIRETETGLDAAPLYALTVVQPSPTVEADVAAAEADLEETVAYAAGAAVPVVTQTRIDHNVASGVLRATVENRISTVVVGWDGAASRGQRVFGEVIDQVLVGTDRLVLVSRVREPISTTTEVTVVLPPGIEYNQGFDEAIRQIKRIASDVGASIRAVAVDDDGEPTRPLKASASESTVEEAFDAVEPEVPTQFETTNWERLTDRLAERTGRSQLIVVVSARRNALGWHPELRTLPKRISGLTDGNFVIVYPARGERDDRQFLEMR